MYITLANQVKIPRLNLGTYQAAPGEVANAVTAAMKAGYHGIDCAAIYKNEPEIAQAMKASEVKREDLFITSKVWNKEQGYETTKAAFEQTIKDLGVEYLDLYLIHWPKTTAKTLETWRAMEELYMAGKIKAIGVSNFKIHHLEAMFDLVQIKPMVNQIELSPHFMQQEVVDFCQSHNIVVTAHSHLRQGKIFECTEIVQIAEELKVSVPQVAIKYLLDQDIVVLPKSVNEKRIIENHDVMAIEFTADQLASLVSLEQGESARVLPDSDHIEF